MAWVVWIFFFFFSSRRRHTRLQGDWSSDVCSSDLRRGDRRHRRASGQTCAIPRRLRTHVRHPQGRRSEEHTSELQSPCNLVCRLLLEKKKKKNVVQADHHQEMTIT